MKCRLSLKGSAGRQSRERQRAVLIESEKNLSSVPLFQGLLLCLWSRTQGSAVLQPIVSSYGSHVSGSPVLETYGRKSRTQNQSPGPVSVSEPFCALRSENRRTRDLNPETLWCTAPLGLRTGLTRLTKLTMVTSERRSEA